MPAVALAPNPGTGTSISVSLSSSVKQGVGGSATSVSCSSRILKSHTLGGRGLWAGAATEAMKPSAVGSQVSRVASTGQESESWVLV